MNLRSIVVTTAASVTLFAGAASAATTYFQATRLAQGSTQASASEAAKQAAVYQCRAQGGSVAGTPQASFFRAFSTNQAGPEDVIIGYEYQGSVRCAKQIADDNGGPQFGDV
ncbi:hypothetical protein [Lysobacter enzymogenes]|uniref:hypothetical protein n=1 Tax=Lysobacter enzymogenes TaxID=69 RepID=UPI001440F82B|nr:hypothetical protein [Lysobacter enzymogenes]